MDAFDRYRAEMNERLLGAGHLGIKRFFNLDTQAYVDGALDARSKELMGLVASIVLRCDDCITYHIKQCVELGISRPQLLEAFNVALVVGGSITIPHLRRAIDRLDSLPQAPQPSKSDVYALLAKQLASVFEGERDFIANLANFSSLIYHSIGQVNWVGFYLLKGDDLVLSAFQGKVACVRIPMGKGVCGTAAKNQSVLIVDDVHQFPGHIACDSASNSEIVLPMVKDGRLIGVLDLDSESFARFDAVDQEGLSHLLALLLDLSDLDSL
ncbi:hypothetical protein MASR2M15_24120 [Anaerolineales bacterium]